MNISTIVSSMLRLGVPLLLASLGVLISAKSGIVNMGMEGNMLFGAFMAAYITDLTGFPFIGFLSAALGGILYSLLMGIMIIKFRGNHVVVGLGLNFVIIGSTYVLLSYIWDSAGYSTPIARLPQIALPWIGRQSVTLLVAAFAVVMVWFMLAKTIIGLRICSVGENPGASDSVGVNVFFYQFLSLAIAGALGGLAGAELSIGQMGYFIKEMTASKGFLAYSAVIFASYNPLLLVITTMLLGLLDALQMRAQTMLNIPGQFLLMLPYLVTLLAMMGVGDTKRPKSVGISYVRGDF